MTGQVTSSTGPWGDWVGPFRCPEGVVTGMRTKTLFDGNVVDLYGVNNVRIKCGDPIVDPNLPETFGSCASEGAWGPWKKCKTGYAVCGIQTWRQDRLYSNGDDMDITDIQLYCCPLFT